MIDIAFPLITFLVVVLVVYKTMTRDAQQPPTRCYYPDCRRQPFSQCEYCGALLCVRHDEGPPLGPSSCIGCLEARLEE